MTNIQRAFCVVLSLIFLGVVAVLPGDFFRHGEIYRQLPLYCFLEKKALQKENGRDRETEMLLQEKNAEHLGEEVEAENRKEQETLLMAEAEEVEKKEALQKKEELQKKKEIQKKEAEEAEMAGKKSSAGKKMKRRLLREIQNRKLLSQKLQSREVQNRKLRSRGTQNRRLLRQRRTNPVKILRRNRRLWHCHIRRLTCLRRNWQILTM